MSMNAEVTAARTHSEETAALCALQHAMNVVEQIRAHLPAIAAMCPPAESAEEIAAREARLEHYRTSVSSWCGGELSMCSEEEQADLVVMALMIVRGKWRPNLKHGRIRTLRSAVAILKRQLKADGFEIVAARRGTRCQMRLAMTEE